LNNNEEYAYLVQMKQRLKKRMSVCDKFVDQDLYMELAKILEGKE